ncbi:MAG: hypothetical protein JWR14_5436 [Caballeronia sp.]|jgi:hypothetical protein|nr:hypothetical protein [Caballeronia sp.]
MGRVGTVCGWISTKIISSSPKPLRLNREQICKACFADRMTTLNSSRPRAAHDSQFVSSASGAFWTLCLD